MGRVIADLLSAVERTPDLAAAEVSRLAPSTPAGRLDLPLAMVDVAAGAAAAGDVDRLWLADVERRREQARRALVDAGRGAELEVALARVVPLAVERFDPADDADVAAHVASGGRLWLLTAAVASALAAGADHDPFAAWARLVVAGWWPVGPVGGTLVVGRVP